MLKQYLKLASIIVYNTENYLTDYFKSIKTQKKNLKAYKNNSFLDKNYYLIIAIIILITIILRVFKLYDFAVLGHDTTRDLLLVYKLINFNEIIYRGPDFSEVWGFLSPIYYYILTPFFYLSNFNPLTPSILTFICNIIALILISYVSLKMFDKTTSVLVTLIYGFSFTVIYESFYGLNPAFLPPISVATFYSLYKIFEGNLKITYHYLYLSVYMSILIGFHVSGFFIFFVILYYLIRYLILHGFSTNNITKLFSNKIVILSLLVFVIIGVMPYVYQEKKFNGWNTTQLIKYYNTTSKNINQDVYKVTAFTNTVSTNISKIYTTDKNISLQIFTYFMLLSLIYITYIYRKDNSPLGFISAYILVYLLSIFILIDFRNTYSIQNYRESWFYAVIIPIITLYLGILLKIASEVKYIKYFVILTIAIFVLENTFNIISYKPKTDNLSEISRISNVLTSDSNGLEYDIYGANASHIYYYLWFNEQSITKKEYYFRKLNWNLKRDASLAYLFFSPGKIDVLESINNIIVDRGLTSYEKIYTNREIEVYKIY